MTDRRRRARRRLRVGGLLVLLALALGLLAATVRERLGLGREIEPLALIHCERRAAPAGPEDLIVDPQRRWLLISATPRRQRGTTGGIHVLDLDAADGPIRLLERDGPPLAPHGMSTVSIDGETYLHVVNHADPAASTVEQYRIEGDTLRHLATVRDPALVAPNDVAAVDARRFYVSNDHGQRRGLLRLLEHPLGLRLGTVRYFDGEAFITVAQRQGYANGLLLSRDGHRLLVAETVAGTVTSYLRDAATGRLTSESYMRFDSGPDNLSRSSDGAMWVVGHSRLVDFVAHARDSARRSPTTVDRVLFYGLTADVERVLLDDGSLLSGGSVAVAYGDRLFVGNVFDPYLLVCTLPPPWVAPVPPRPLEPSQQFH